MTRPNKPITKEIRYEILTRTLFASSRQEVTRSIFETIVEAGVDWRTVSVDDVKPILVDALRAFSGKTVWIDERVVI